MTVEPQLTEAGLTEADVQLVVIWLVSFWLEGLLYGIYLYLFTATLPVLFRNAPRNASSTIFSIGNVLMFVVISIVTGQFLISSAAYFPSHSPNFISFAYQTDVRRRSQILGNMDYWVNYVPLVSGVVVCMIGDILMIYRCFLVWQRSYRAILLSVILAALSSGFHIATVWFARQVTFNLFQFNTWRAILLPPVFYFSQCAITTSLIAWKIWSQSWRSTNVGLVSVHVPCLLSITRIIVESAVIYTAAMLILVFVIAFEHPARELVHTCLLPTTGIVFVLMSLRIHAVQEESRHMPASPSLLPAWLVDEPPSTDLGPEPVPKEVQHPN
ncbi:hypothetical protein BKA70DRAFT_1480191 [Coprinopsis sp. MPI-PUGE-AT-0042]|nr:hypothetical protein BKA70DRAFT_1480191 [Coprinopsis sp. MPI-PUGE-AT-0042]